MSPQVPSDPNDRALEEAMTRSRAKQMIDESKGFLVLAYGTSTSATGLFDGEFVFWGAPAPLVLLYLLWQSDMLKMLGDDSEEANEGAD